MSQHSVIFRNCVIGGMWCQSSTLVLKSVFEYCLWHHHAVLCQSSELHWKGAAPAKVFSGYSIWQDELNVSNQSLLLQLLYACTYYKKQDTEVRKFYIYGRKLNGMKWISLHFLCFYTSAKELWLWFCDWLCLYIIFSIHTASASLKHSLHIQTHSYKLCCLILSINII